MTEAQSIEASRASLEEMMFRIKQRDGWLKFQLVGQLVLFAMASGIEGFGFKSTSLRPELLAALAIPSSFVLTVLYCTEDRLVHELSTYRADAFSGAFEHRRAFALPLAFRFVAQCVSFALIPALLSIYGYRSLRADDWSVLMRAITVAEFLLWVGIVVLLVLGYLLRRDRPSAKVVPSADTPPEVTA